MQAFKCRLRRRLGKLVATGAKRTWRYFYIYVEGRGQQQQQQLLLLLLLLVVVVVVVVVLRNSRRRCCCLSWGLLYYKIAPCWLLERGLIRGKDFFSFITTSGLALAFSKLSPPIPDWLWRSLLSVPSQNLSSCLRLISRPGMEVFAQKCREQLMLPCTFSTCKQCVDWFDVDRHKLGKANGKVYKNLL
jgi:hypothetical protein